MRSWQWMASGAALGFIIHSAMLLHIPDNYTSVARLNYSSSGPQQAVGREVLHLADSALSDNEVARIMARHGLYGNLRAEGRGNEAAAWFRRDLRFSTREAETTGHGSVLRVAYSDADPERAQKVARDVITLVIDENLRVHAARFPHDAVVNQEDARWKGTTLGAHVASMASSMPTTRAGPRQSRRSHASASNQAEIMSPFFSWRMSMCMYIHIYLF